MNKEQLLKLAEALRPAVAASDHSVQSLIYQWNLGDLLEHLTRECDAKVCLTVSDLVYCSQKYWFRLQHPLPVIEQNIYGPWGVYGRLIHLGLEHLLREKWNGVRIEVEVERRLWLNNGEPTLVKITGRIDALRVTDGGEVVVYEFKSSRGDSEQPKQPHIMQLRIYMLMASATKGYLVYVNPDRVAEYEINNPMNDVDLKQLVKETIENTKHPRWDWECSYCPYNMMCPYKHFSNNYKRR
ncbi:CRISPR-associated protein Cas4 [Desulfurococcaceae archaeon MEX13E-LK6-19]|nr:CRISPR-associated protein Cas4 [Desulfurococcaceae archaeon MEX13E-LK6-19]